MKWISYGFWPCFWMVLNCRAFQVSVVMIHIWSKIKTDNWHILVSIYIDSYHYNWYKIQLSTWTDTAAVDVRQKYWMKCQLESYLHRCILANIERGQNCNNYNLLSHFVKFKCTIFNIFNISIAQRFIQKTNSTLVQIWLFTETMKYTTATATAMAWAWRW